MRHFPPPPEPFLNKEGSGRFSSNHIAQGQEPSRPCAFYAAMLHEGAP